MKLSIIIATYDRHQLLLQCLNSINNLDSSITENIEVIVVDQSATIFKKSFDYLFDISIYKSPIGASIARNFGARHAKGEYLWFLDDDATINSINLKNLKGNVVFFDWKEKPFTPVSNTFFRKINILRKSGTPFFALRKDVFDKVHGFDERLGPGVEINSGEDSDILLRVDKVTKIKGITIIGSVSHSLEMDFSRLSSYAFCRGVILRKNKEYTLTLVELLYCVYVFLKLRNFIRMRNFLKGYASKYKII
jgi:glycosyltransferase involved in cell wall biosynthesis